MRCFVLFSIFALFATPLAAVKDYRGHWRFVKEDFSKRHPWWPGFMIKKALKTRLVLSDEHFVQYLKPGEMHGQPREIIEVKALAEGWSFLRVEKGDEVSFRIIPRGERWFYIEEGKEYEVVKESEAEVKTWAEAS